MSSRSFLAGRRSSYVLAWAVALAAPLLATAVALGLRSFGPVAAVSIFLLAVILAALFGRMWSGFVAAFLSFLSLNFFFTPPKYTLSVEKFEDIIALMVFLAVSVIVGMLVSRALEERERARRKESETALANALTNGLLLGRPLDKVLEEFARGVVDLLGLARCEVRVDTGDGDVEAIATQRGAPQPEPGESLEIPLSAGNRNVGSIAVAGRAGQPAFDDAERALFAGFARQVLLGLERLRLDAEVRRARLDSESNQMRAALFSSVTHDLRTPLASIKAAVSGLLDEEAHYDRAQRVDLLQTILEETDRLNRVVGNILDLARMRAGALEPARQPTHIDEVIESVLVRMGPRLDGVRMKTIFRPDLGPMMIDPVQIDQVVTNILENALRFSPPGGEIRISAGVIHNRAQLRIADQGPGVPEADRERVFEAFDRGGAEREGGGTGLGLAIARAILSVHGGRIWIEGAPGGGTAVVAELPVEATEGVATS